MSAPPYMKLYWADYHQDTRHLTRDEHGAYFLLLGEAWNRGGYLPDDDVLLARLALATPKEWERLKPIVMAYFRPAPKGRWRHKRIAEELAAYDDVSRKRKEAGRKGGSTTHGKHGENQQANAQAIANQKPTKPEPEPEPEREESSEANASGAVVGAGQDLDAMAWQTAVVILIDQGRMTEPAARRFFGKLLSANDLAAKEMLPSLTSARVRQTQDPQGYLTQAAKGVAIRRGPQAPEKRVSWV